MRNKNRIKYRRRGSTGETPMLTKTGERVNISEYVDQEVFRGRNVSENLKLAVKKQIYYLLSPTDNHDRFTVWQNPYWLHSIDNTRTHGSHFVFRSGRKNFMVANLQWHQQKGSDQNPIALIHSIQGIVQEGLMPWSKTRRANTIKLPVTLPAFSVVVPHVLRSMFYVLQAGGRAGISSSALAYTENTNSKSTAEYIGMLLQNNRSQIVRTAQYSSFFSDKEVFFLDPQEKTFARQLRKMGMPN